MSIACVIVAGTGNRRDLIDRVILPSILPQGFDETLVVGDHHDGRGYRYLAVPALLANTVDALVKRDVGALASRAETIVYLSDDHALDPDFLATFAQYRDQRWDVLVPHRYTVRSGERIYLNMGQNEGYCGGHGGVFRREVIERCPWSCGPHSRVWDVLISQKHQQYGFRYEYAGHDLSIVDVEPNATPWA